MFKRLQRATPVLQLLAVAGLAACSSATIAGDAGDAAPDRASSDAAADTGSSAADAASADASPDAGDDVAADVDVALPPDDAMEATDAAGDAPVDVTAPADGGSTVPAACQGLARIGTGTAGRYWSRVLRTSVTFGGIQTVMSLDATEYIPMWQQPGAMIQWPGNLGTTVQPVAMPNQYFSERFTVPADGSPPARVNYAISGSGGWSNVSFALSICPGDFGQTGTQIQPHCSRNMPFSSSGLTVVVSDAPSTTYCTVAPGQTYYLNVLPEADLPTNDVAITRCTSRCVPWIAVN